MKANGINHLWANLMVAELIRCGVSEFCVSPGSRSTPLALAVAGNPYARASVHFDERGSAFRALGLAKATGTPAVLVCTSGTALANYYPAIVEASQSATPMIILSADRPMELRCTGTSQTSDQVKIFGNYLRWEVDLLPPDMQVSPNLLLTTVDQAVRMSSGSPAGPVQLNCQYREPLAPLDQPQDFGEYCSALVSWQSGTRPYTEHLSTIRAYIEESSRVAELAARARRGVIVAGTLPSYIDPTPIIELAERWQWPLIADVCSGVRSTGRQSNNVLCHADLYLRSATICETLKPDFVLQFGTSQISKSITTYASNATAHYLVVVDRPERFDPHSRVTLRLESNPEQLVVQLQNATGVHKSDILKKYTEFDRLAAESIQKALLANGDSISELQIASEIARITLADRGIFLATSMPIREFECVAMQTEHRLRISANRGANGIDGTIASAIGFSDGLELPVTLLVGDLAALHDLNSLALLKQSRYPIAMIILNNDGGGIFSMLPVAEIKTHFEEFFGTPHGLDFRNAAEMFGVKYHCPSSVKDFGSVYRHSLKSKKSAIIEISCSRKDNVQQHRRLWKAVQERIEKQVI